MFSEFMPIINNCLQCLCLWVLKVKEMKDNDKGVLMSKAVDVNLNHWVNIFSFEIATLKFLIFVKPRTLSLMSSFALLIFA